jgi:hypothetical protein
LPHDVPAAAVRRVTAFWTEELLGRLELHMTRQLLRDLWALRARERNGSS